MLRPICPYLLIFIALMLLQQTHANDTRGLVFNRLTTEQGLSSNLVNAVVQDDNGFIWIGTHEGLCRFDGYRMLEFHNSAYTGSLSSSNVSALVTDGEYLWVGTWDGLNLINTRTLSVKRVNTGASRVIRAMLRDKTGNIWVGTSEGLIVFENGKETFRRITAENSDLSHDMVRSFHQGVGGEIWIGTYDGLNRYDNGIITTYDLKGNYKPLLKNNLVCAIAAHKENDSLLWVGTETGLILFNKKSALYKHYNQTNTNFSNEVIKAIHALNDSTLLLGTDFGLNLFNVRSGEVKTYYHDPLSSNTITSNVIWQIFEDTNNMLWLVTSNGMSILYNAPLPYHFHEVYYSFANPRIGNQVRDILVASNNDIWLATIHGVVQKRGSSAITSRFSSSSPLPYRILLDNVHCIRQDSLGRIWIGTAGGLNIWCEKEQTMHAIVANTGNGLTSNYISNFAIDNSGTLWLAAWEGGLFRGAIPDGNLSGIIFTRVLEDGNGRVLKIGEAIYYGSGDKLWKIDPISHQKEEVNPVNSFLSGRTITGIAQCREEKIYIGFENGILRYNPARDNISSLTINTGRPRKMTNLQVDKSGIVWATTQNIVIRADIDSGTFFTIPAVVNLPLKSFYNHASTQAPNGNIFFGGDNGFIELFPAKVKGNGSMPELFLTGLKINNEAILPSDTTFLIEKDIAFASRLQLKHFQNSVTLEFSTLSYPFMGANQYAYRLLPVNSNWTSTPGNKNFAVFSNLKPGDYIFEVKGTNHQGTWSEVKSLAIEISPSIWASNSFMVLYMVLLIALTYLISRIYSYRQRLKSELQVVRLENQHAKALYESKIQFFTNISHEFRTPLSLIIPPLKELLKNRDPGQADSRMLNIAHSNAKRLAKLVNQLLDFRKIESARLDLNLAKTDLNLLLEMIFRSFNDMASRSEIDYSFVAGDEILTADIDKEKFEAIVFNLLSNAFKYTPFGGVVSLKLYRDGQMGVIVVNDSGPGIDKKEQEKIFDPFYRVPDANSHETGTGIGLTLAREYALLHGGALAIKSYPGEGSEFTFSFPLVNLSSTPNEITELNTLENNSYSINTIQTQNQPSPNGKKRIIVVDDNEDLLAMMEITMRDTFQVITARNGEEGLKQILDTRPHLVICDVTMPVMDGLELCSRLRKNQSIAHIPLILLTAKSLEIHKLEGMERGADIYITKPFEMEYLMTCINGIFRRDNLLREHLTLELLMTPGEGESIKTADDKQFLKKVMMVIDTNLNNPDLSAELISSNIGYSTTHLYRKLKQLTGFSTKDIIINYRMEKAAAMLVHKTGNITEIMYAVGLSSLASFSRSFKEKYGISPSQYESARGNKKHPSLN